MQPRQKAALGVFLCLSLVMVAFSITRVSHIRGASGVDVPWVFFWQFAEASVAVLMGSLTVFRTLLVAERERRWSPSPAGSPQGGGGGVGKGKGGMGALYTFRQRVRMLGKSSRDLESQDEGGLPQIPGPTMTGLRTYIRRNNRDSGIKTNVLISQQSTLAEEEDSILRTKEKEDRMTEEVRQVAVSPPPLRNPQFAYHYPVRLWSCGCVQRAWLLTLCRYGARNSVMTKRRFSIRPPLISTSTQYGPTRPRRRRRRALGAQHCMSGEGHSIPYILFNVGLSWHLRCSGAKGNGGTGVKGAKGSGVSNNGTCTMSSRPSNESTVCNFKQFISSTPNTYFEECGITPSPRRRPQQGSLIAQPCSERSD